MPWQGWAMLAAILAMGAVLEEALSGIGRWLMTIAAARLRGERVRSAHPFVWTEHRGWTPPHHSVIITDRRVIVRRGGFPTIMNVAAEDVEAVRHYEWHDYYRGESIVVHAHGQKHDEPVEALIAFGQPARRIGPALAKAGISVEWVPLKRYGPPPAS